MFFLFKKPFLLYRYIDLFIFPRIYIVNIFKYIVDKLVKSVYTYKQKERRAPIDPKYHTGRSP